MTSAIGTDHAPGDAMLADAEQHLAIAVAALLAAIRAEPRQAGEWARALEETAHAWNAASSSSAATDFRDAAFVSPEVAAEMLGISVGAVHALFRRHGDAAGVRDGRFVWMRASWVVARAAREKCRVASSRRSGRPGARSGTQSG